MDLQINSKTLWFKVENDADRKVIDNIVQTGRIPLTCCEMLICVGDNVLLLNRYKKMSLRHGMDTLYKTLELTGEPTRIKPARALPDYFFQTYLTEGMIDDEKSVKLAGDITRNGLRSLVVESHAKSQKRIKVKRPVVYLNDNDIVLHQIQKKDDIETAYLRKDLEYGKKISFTIPKTNKIV